MPVPRSLPAKETAEPAAPPPERDHHQPLTLAPQQVRHDPPPPVEKLRVPDPVAITAPRPELPEPVPLPQAPDAGDEPMSKATPQPITTARPRPGPPPLEATGPPPVPDATILPEPAPGEATSAAPEQAAAGPVLEIGTIEVRLEPPSSPPPAPAAPAAATAPGFDEYTPIRSYSR